jgi:hypothetical protein
MSLTSYRAAPSRDTLFGLPRGALLEPFVCPIGNWAILGRLQQIRYDVLRVSLQGTLI